MNILLVVPKYDNTSVANFDYLFPIGLSYISSALKKANNTVNALNLNHYNGKIIDLVNERLDKKKYDFIGTGGNALTYTMIETIIRTAKNHNTKPKIILGGPIITTMSKPVFEEFGIDFGVIGEGEETVVELIDCLAKDGNLRDVAGIIFKKGNDTIITKPRIPIKDLDALPFPDYEGLEFKKQLENLHSNVLIWTSILDKPRVYPLLASRSCPFQCTFCYHWGPYRKRSISNIMAEINMAIDKYDINFLQIYDDCFSYDKKRLNEFCSEIVNLMKVKKKNIKWFCNLIVNSVDSDILTTLKNAGCIAVSYGFESFSRTVLRSMNKAITPQQIEFAFNETIKKKLHVAATFIFGDIAETTETAKETLDWWVRNAQGQIRLAFVMPYPGSKIYDYCIQKGLIKDVIAFAKYWSGTYHYLNITEKMSDKEIHTLERRIWRLTSKYSKYVIPSSWERSPPNDYRLTLKCPFCHRRIKYNNLHHMGNSFMFVFELICRNCGKSFFAVSPFQRLITLGSYFVPRLGFYIGRINSDVAKAKLLLAKRTIRHY